MKKLLTSVVIPSLFFFVVFVCGTNAASLQFDPTTVTTQQDETFDIKVDVDSGTNEILGVDAKITYDKALLTVEEVTDGTFFPNIGKVDYSTQGEIYIAGIVDDPGDFKKGTGTLATIKFKAVTDGTATLAFTCTPGETGKDSNIVNNDFAATDVINCTENGTSRVTIGVGGSETTATPSPTGPTSTPYPTPSNLPQTGMFTDMISNTLVQISVIMVAIGLVIKFLLL